MWRTAPAAQAHCSRATKPAVLGKHWNPSQLDFPTDCQSYMQPSSFAERGAE